MRIAVFSDNFYPELSGIADSILSLGEHLAARGHCIRFYAPRYARKDFALLGLPVAEIHPRDTIGVVRLPSIPYPTGTMQGRMVFPTGLRWRHLRGFRPDVIHVHLPFGVGLEGLMAARALGTPLVGTNHTPVTEFLRYAPIRAAWCGRLAAQYTAWFYSHCDFVSSPSGTIFAEMENFRFRGRHRVISNPIRLDAFGPLPHRQLLKATFGFSDFTILYAGRLAPEKRVDLLVRAIAGLVSEVPAVRLALLGRGSAEGALKSLCRSLRVAERVKFLGFLPNSTTVAEVYNAADVFAIASTAETQSIATMQAMACGLPVVGVRAWGLGEYINGMNGLLVDPGDVPALKQALAYLATHPQARTQLGQGGQKFVTRFSAPAIASEWEEIYQTVAADFHHHLNATGMLPGRDRSGTDVPFRGRTIALRIAQESDDALEFCDSRIQ